MFRESKGVAEKVPKTFIPDGANNFHDAYRKEFLSPYGEGPSAVHIRHIRLAGDMNNNKMERQNGEFREREKVMRSLKRDDSPIIKGLQIYHNYFRPHMEPELVELDVKGALEGQVYTAQPTDESPVGRCCRWGCSERTRTC